MRFLKWYVMVLVVIVQIIAGCGGGGGGGTAAPPTTKTVTLKFTSQSSNSGDLLGGFLLKFILPAGAILPVDSSGTPLSSAVYLSGQFVGVSPQLNTYDSLSRELTVSVATINGYALGEFMTVVVTVPSSYVPNASDITVFNAFTPITGVNMPSVTATLTFI